jgi:hypothetical protein
MLSACQTGDAGTTSSTLAGPTDAEGWSRGVVDPAVFGGQGEQKIWAVVAGGPGLVAVGQDGPRAAIWASGDGASWQRVGGGTTLFPGETGAVAMGVAAGTSGLVAVGYADSSQGRDAAAWTSTDRDEWVRGDPGATGPNSTSNRAMMAVTADSSGMVAVGYEGLDAAAWTSPDGGVWSRIEGGEDAFGGQGYRLMRAVIPFAGGFVAGGFEAVSADSRAAVWASPDGITWQRVPHTESIFGGEGNQAIMALAAGGPGLVAVGYDRFEAAVWVSANGATWTRVAASGVPSADTGTRGMMSVVLSGSGLVAAGWDGLDAAVWTSPDGIAWARVPAVESVFGGQGNRLMTSIVGFSARMVAVGWEAPVSDADGAVWERAASSGS